MIDKAYLYWLTNCPSSDINFKNNLKEANADTLIEALKDSQITKTARKLIEARLTRKAKKVKNEKK